MSGQEARSPERPAPAAPDRPAEQSGGEARPADDAQPDAGKEPGEPDQPQDAWTARRDLVDHAPTTMNVGARSAFNGGLHGGTQHGGISGGNFSGDVFLGSKTEIFQLTMPAFAASVFASASGSLSGSASGTGEIPRAAMERLSAHFAADDEVMAHLSDRLRDERVLVLSGGRFTGRRTAALMLLHRLGASPVRALDRDTGPGSLADLISGDGSGTTDGADSANGVNGAAAAGSGEPAGGTRPEEPRTNAGGQPHAGEEGEDGAGAPRPALGYALCDLSVRRDNPLREHHLLAVRDRLAAQNAYLVITVGPGTALEDITPEEWRAPAAADVLAAHLGTGTTPKTTAELLGHPLVKDFLSRVHQPREAARFARLLVRYAAGEVTEEAVARFSWVSLEHQVQEWFAEDEALLHLRDKAFLVALAAFDGGPYPLTAELSDLLYRYLQETENPSRVPVVPVFGTHIGRRLQVARAHSFVDDEQTEWGPVAQTKAAFLDERTSALLLSTVWTGHPSARPALVRWLRHLADDGRPLVRTRAASTVAVLALTDLPSAMALIIEPWGTSDWFRHRLVAVNALTLAHFIDTPNVPRILDAWCSGDDQRLRWVAVRAYGLLGPERPQQALAALRGAARRLHNGTADTADTADTEGPDARDTRDVPGGELALELAQSVGLLLLSPAADQVLTELRAHIDDDRAVRRLTLGGFVSACTRTEDDEPHGTPLVLGWYARAVGDGGPAAHGVPYLWRAALADPHTTGDALGTLREWVLIADRSRAAEWALAALLPALVTTAIEHHRLSHLLRTMPGEDGERPPSVAARLLTTLPHR
ncbi:hypothetical protein [Streptomyces sp. NPDC020996]|uniref:hypothetical protein n=1 Tax=Streptomyces sp. NPDC020996 TaxID=3154791 RepID=UPI0033C87494